MISVHGLTKRYALGSTVITAIDNVSLDIRTGEFWQWAGHRAAASLRCSTLLVVSTDLTRVRS